MGLIGGRLLFRSGRSRCSASAAVVAHIERILPSGSAASLASGSGLTLGTGVSPCNPWESLGFDSRGRRFTSPLHPRGRLIYYSTERPQNKRKTTHRDHHSSLVHPAHAAMACISRGHLFLSLDLGNQDFGG